MPINGALLSGFALAHDGKVFYWWPFQRTNAIRSHKGMLHDDLGKK